MPAASFSFLIELKLCATMNRLEKENFMVMYSQTRNISTQARKLGELEEIYNITNVDYFSADPKSFSEKVNKVLSVTYNYRRGESYDLTVGAILKLLNSLVNNQRLEAKADLYTLLKEEAEGRKEEAEGKTND